MNAKERERLLEAIRLGDADALWRLWRELERGTPMPGWRVGTMPSPAALIDDLIETSRFLPGEEGTESENIMTLFYHPQTNAWILTDGPQEWYGLVGPYGEVFLTPDLSRELAAETAAELIESVWLSMINRNWERRPGTQEVSFSISGRRINEDENLAQGDYIAEIPEDYILSEEELAELAYSAPYIRILRGPFFNQVTALPPSSVENILLDVGWWYRQETIDSLAGLLRENHITPSNIRDWLSDRTRDGSLPEDIRDNRGYMEALRSAFGLPEAPTFAITDEDHETILNLLGQDYGWMYVGRTGFPANWSEYLVDVTTTNPMTGVQSSDRQLRSSLESVLSLLRLHEMKDVDFIRSMSIIGGGMRLFWTIQDLEPLNVEASIRTNSVPPRPIYMEEVNGLRNLVLRTETA